MTTACGLISMPILPLLGALELYRERKLHRVALERRLIRELRKVLEARVHVPDGQQGILNTAAAPDMARLAVMAPRLYHSRWSGLRGEGHREPIFPFSRAP